jgi:hypothetical protein
VSGDTVKGYIDQKEWARNPEDFNFKKTDNDVSHTYTLSSVSYFEISGVVAYRRFATSVSMDEVGLNNADKHVTRSVADTIFLRIIQEGKFVSLFTYRDKIKNRFFIQDAGSDVQELVYQLYSDKKKVHLNEGYKNQLLLSANKAGTASEKLKWQINKASYGNKSLIDIINKINGISDTEIKEIRKKSRVASRPSFFAGGGISMNTLSYTGRPEWTSDIKSSAFASPFISGGMDIAGNPAVRKLIFRAELSFGYTKFHTVSVDKGISSESKIDYTFDQYSVSISPQVIYNFYNKENLKIYGGIGFRFNRSFYKNNNYTITSIYPSDNVTSIPNYFDMKGTWPSEMIQVGALINKKLEISINYTKSMGAINDFAYFWADNLHSFRLGVSGYIWR